MSLFEGDLKSVIDLFPKGTLSKGISQKQAAYLLAGAIAGIKKTCRNLAELRDKIHALLSVLCSLRWKRRHELQARLNSVPELPDFHLEPPRRRLSDYRVHDDLFAVMTKTYRMGDLSSGSLALAGRAFHTEEWRRPRSAFSSQSKRYPLRASSAP